MEAAQLRIGNLIPMEGLVFTLSIGNSSEDYPPDGVIEITRDNFPDILRDIETRKSDGIPLTEEWLLKFGFEKGYDANNTIDTWMIFTLKAHLFDLKCTKPELTFSTGTLHFNPKFVHQLQNLYFALTGEELKLKE